MNAFLKKIYLPFCIVAVLIASYFCVVSPYNAGYKAFYEGESEGILPLFYEDYSLFNYVLAYRISEDKDAFLENMIVPNEEMTSEEIRANSRAMLIEWSNNLDNNYRNLEYYVRGENEQIIGKKELLDRENNKDLYRWYLQVTFDEYGYPSFQASSGGKVEYAELAEKGLRNAMYDSGLEGTLTKVNPLKNISIVYAVPVVLEYQDFLYDYIHTASYLFRENNPLTLFISLIFISLLALFLPTSQIKEQPLLKRIYETPFELLVILLCIFILSPFATLSLFLSQMVIETSGALLVLNSLLVFVSMSGGMLSIWLIKLMLFDKQYLVTKSWIGRFLHQSNISIKNFIHQQISLQLSVPNKKVILELVLINCMVVWFLAVHDLVFLIVYGAIIYLLLSSFWGKYSVSYKKLAQTTSLMASGDLQEEIPHMEMLEDIEENLRYIQQNFAQAVQEEVKSTKMKTELISNVSHDLKTPLTSIITYLNLLKEKEKEEENLQYLEIMEKSALRLKQLIVDLFEISKADSGNVVLDIVDVDIVSLIQQCVYEFTQEFKERNLIIKKDIPASKIILKLDSQKTYRIFENLLSNIVKYALPNTRVYLKLAEHTDYIQIEIRNISKEELDFEPQEITERFVRGDKSRNTEGSGLGLAIAKSFTELQGGMFKIETDSDIFKVVIRLPYEITE